MDAKDNRYSDAPRNADYTIEQRWETYSDEEHDRWKRLYRRQQQVLPGRACDEYIDAIRKLDLSADGVPHMGELSDRLGKLTGWSVVPVAGLVPDEVFFDHLANKRFPAGAFIRPESEFDYLEEPDVFHDIFGHVPMLAVPIFAQFMQAYGEGGMRAMKLGQLKNLARLYWYTVEFGLVKSPDGLRIFGAGILSSPHESAFSLEDGSPNRVEFNLERIMRTKHIIDDFQQTYFVVDSLEQLLESCYEDFGDVYARVRSQPDYEAHDIAPGDVVLHQGTRDYFEQKRAS
jgi:phenylalanine-4-hydroxylase